MTESQRDLERMADEMLSTPQARRLFMREEAPEVEGTSDVLDFIVNGGAFTAKAVLGRLAVLAISAGLLDSREAARLTGCSIRSIQRRKKKCRS